MAESVYAHASAQSPVRPGIVHGLSLTDPRCAEVLNSLPGVAKLVERYPTAPRNDLIVAADQLERAIEQNGHIRANLLLNMAADWLAQTIRDLACSDVSSSHTEEFGHTLADVEALVAGAHALMVQEGAIPSLNTALVLIERARDSLVTLNEGSAA